MIISLISLTSARELIDQQCELSNVFKNTDHQKSDEKKMSRRLNNCEMEVNETSENEDDENNVFINAPLLIENRMSSIPYIVNNKTSNRNTSRKTSERQHYCRKI